MTYGNFLSVHTLMMVLYTFKVSSPYNFSPNIKCISYIISEIFSLQSERADAKKKKKKIFTVN